MTNPIICALDTPSVEQAISLAREIHPHIGAVKCGLEFFTANGPDGIKAIADTGTPIFLDLKFHDIPNTVAKAVTEAVKLDVFMLTIHTAGGSTMMQAAAEAVAETSEKLGKKRPIIVGVTVLTSMDQDDLHSIGVTNPVNAQVLQLATLAHQSGLDGVVCSPHEISAIKDACGNAFQLVVPGIRPATAASNDQKRIMTPEQAVSLGADYLVIGRPVTQSENPSETAKNIYKSIAL